MTRPEAEKLIKKLLPHTFRESVFSTPIPDHLIRAIVVFDAIRESDPPMTRTEFNRLADEVDNEA